MVFLDEFFVNFDFWGINEVLEMFGRFVNDGLNIVVVFYVWRFLMKFVNEVVVIVVGRVVLKGSLEEVIFKIEGL